MGEIFLVAAPPGQRHAQAGGSSNTPEPFVITTADKRPASHCSPARTGGVALDRVRSGTILARMAGAGGVGGNDAFSRIPVLERLELKVGPAEGFPRE